MLGRSIYDTEYQLNTLASAFSHARNFFNGLLGDCRILSDQEIGIELGQLRTVNANMGETGKGKDGRLEIMILIDLLGDVGGAERQVHLLSHALRRRAHGVHICCLKGGVMSERMRAEGFRITNVDLERIYSWRGAAATSRLVRLVKRENIDAILSYHETSDYLGAILALLARVPVVSTRRDMGFKLKRRHVWVYRLINPWFDHITTVSEAIREILIRTQWAGRNRITVIPNGVELHDTGNGPTAGGWSEGLEDHCLKVCNLANIRPVKGQTDLVRAAARVSRMFPDVRFYLVGKRVRGDSYCDQVEREIVQLGLGSVVRFTGEVRREDVPSILSKMDIFACSSLSEGMSNAILEAMAAGKPVVATAVGGNRELVINGQTGYLVPAGDPQAMSEALGDLLKDGNLRREMGLRARQVVEKDSSIDRMVERYEDVLNYARLHEFPGVWHRMKRGGIKIVSRGLSWVRSFLAEVTYMLGVIHACNLYKRLFRKGRVRILCLHDVSKRAVGRESFSVYTSPEAFEAFLNFIAKRYLVVDLKTAVKALAEDMRLQEDWVALTFDDCYKGWVDYVGPLCGVRGTPYAVFVTTDPLDTGLPLAYDLLVDYAERTWRKVADLSRWGMGMFVLGGAVDNLKFVEKLGVRLRALGREERISALEEIGRYLGVSTDPKIFGNLMLAWKDLQNIDKSGATIGFHGVTHRFLGDLDERECRWEIEESKRRMEEMLGRNVQYFAYPFGVIGKKGGMLKAFLKSAGVRFAFTLNQGPTRGFDPFAIDRLNVSRGMFTRPDGRFQEALLAFELSDLGDALFKIRRLLREERTRGTYS